MAERRVHVGAGLAGLLLTAAVVGGAAAVPSAGATASADAVSVTPVATTQQRICPGPLAGPLEGGGGLGTFGDPTTVVGTVGGGGADARALEYTDIAEVDSDARPSALSAVGVDDPLAEGAALLAAAQTQRAELSTIAGLAAAPCSDPANVSWLVAGATTVGRSAQLLLTNGSGVASTVDLEIWTADGPVDVPGLSGIPVGVDLQRTLPLSGFAPDASAIVVRVQSSGGAIAAALEQQVVRGIDPGGVDLASPTTAPAREQVVTGIRVADAAAAATAASTEGFADLRPALRLLAPAEAGTATVEVVDEAGATAFRTTTALASGRVVDLPLDGLADGAYTAFVVADADVVASARTSTYRVSEDPISGFPTTSADLAWVGAAEVLEGGAAVAVPDGPDARLSFANPGAEPVVVRVVGPDGGTTEVTLAPRSAAGAAVATGAVSVVRGSGVAVAVAYAGEDQLAAFGVPSATAGNAPVDVHS